MDAAAFTDILTANALLHQGDTVVSGISAGPDSTALLSLLCSCSLDLDVIAVYVDHGLRPAETDRERRHVETLARRFNLRFEHTRVDARGHQRKNRTSLEESCRILRYRALHHYREVHRAAAVAVGHTADDQAEEVLLRLFRGAGLKGLAGMNMQSDRLIRPLLETSKEELLDYLGNLGIGYCLDSSNMDRSFLRNRLRLDILPSLHRHFNASLTATLRRTTILLQAENDYLEEAAEEALVACTRSPVPAMAGECRHIITRVPFLGQHIAIRRRVVEEVLLRCGIRPQFQHIETVCRFAESAGNGKEHHLPNGLRLFADGEDLIFDFPGGRQRGRGRLPDRAFAPRKIELSAQSGAMTIETPVGNLHLEHLESAPKTLKPGEILLDRDRLGDTLVLRPSRQGDRFIPRGMKGRKTVRRFLADCRVVRQQRDLYPVLVCGDDIAAVVGLRADDRFAAGPATTSCLLVRWSRGPA